MNTLKVTPEELMNKADLLEAKAKEILACTNNICDRINGVGTEIWQSAGVDQAKKKVVAMKEDDMADIQSLIAERVNDLREMAAKYDISNDNTQKAVNSLPDDVISF